MYADVINVVVRQTDDLYGGEIDELVAVRFSPPEQELDPAAVTQAAREHAMREGFTRITFDERRSYTDAGASGSSLTFVLELLGSGATGVALQELVNFIKSRVSGASESDLAEWFREASPDDLRDYAVSDAERALDFRRGDLEVEAFDTDRHEIRLRARSRSTRQLYRIVSNADGTLKVRRLTESGSKSK
jgi:hypothetical protein